MFENESMFKFVYLLLVLASIIIPGPIVPIIGVVIAISVLAYKIKCAKESQEGLEAFMLDIAILAIVLIINGVFFVMRISIEEEYEKHDYSVSTSKEMTASELAEDAIFNYKINNFSQFSEGKNNIIARKSGFKKFLQNDLEIKDIRENGDKLICKVGTDTIIFTITKDDIEFIVK